MDGTLEIIKEDVTLVNNFNIWFEEQFVSVILYLAEWQNICKDTCCTQMQIIVFVTRLALKKKLEERVQDVFLDFEK